MRSRSRAQHRMMAMVAHDKGAARRLGISQADERTVVRADQKFGRAKIRRLPEHVKRRK